MDISCLVCIIDFLALKLQPVRYDVDAWDDMMMDRDKRLTGHKRGQQVRVLQSVP